MACLFLSVHILSFTWRTFSLKYLRPNINGSYSGAVLEVRSKYLKETLCKQKAFLHASVYVPSHAVQLWWK